MRDLADDIFRHVRYIPFLKFPLPPYRRRRRRASIDLAHVEVRAYRRGEAVREREKKRKKERKRGRKTERKKIFVSFFINLPRIPYLWQRYARVDIPVFRFPEANAKVKRLPIIAISL